LAALWKCSFFETSARLKVNNVECFYEAVRNVRNLSKSREDVKEKKKSKKTYFCTIL
jgi:hypothetical protein